MVRVLNQVYKDPILLVSFVLSPQTAYLRSVEYDWIVLHGGLKNIAHDGLCPSKSNKHRRLK